LLGDGDATEGLERLFLKLVAPTGGATLDPQNIASVYVGEASASSNVGFAEAQVRIAERGFATAVIVVHRSGSTTGAASVDYAMTAGDATAGVDFQGATIATVSWADGDANPKWIEFSILDDGVTEATEFFELSLQNANGATIGTKNSIQVLIADGAGQFRAPNSVAGAGQTIASGARVSLDGTGSNDPDGDMLTYQWTQTSGAAVNLEDAATVTASFTAPTVSSDTLLRFELTVSDGFLQDTASTSVTVQNPTSGGNKKKGGGSTSWIAILWLLLIGAARARCRKKRSLMH
jgi:hypothetical protein